jgi:hypothetical protein
MNAPGKILFACTACGYRARIPEMYIGKPVHCPSCKVVQVAERGDHNAPPTGMTEMLPRIEAAVTATAAGDGKIVLDCGGCGYKARIPAKYSGTAVKCPGCGISITPGSSSRPPTGDTAAISKLERAAVPAAKAEAVIAPQVKVAAALDATAALDPSPAKKAELARQVAKPLEIAGKYTPPMAKPIAAPAKNPAGHESSGNRPAADKPTTSSIHPRSRKVIEPMKPTTGANAPKAAPVKSIAPMPARQAPQSTEAFKPSTEQIPASSPFAEGPALQRQVPNVAAAVPAAVVVRPAAPRVTEHFPEQTAPVAKRAQAAAHGSTSRAEESLLPNRRRINKQVALVAVLLLTFCGSSVFLYFQQSSTQSQLDQRSLELEQTKKELDLANAALKESEDKRSTTEQRLATSERERERAENARTEIEKKRIDSEKARAILDTRVAFLKRRVDELEGKTAPTVIPGTQQPGKTQTVVIQPQPQVFHEDEPTTSLDPLELY